MTREEWRRGESDYTPKKVAGYFAGMTVLCLQRKTQESPLALAVV